MNAIHLSAFGSGFDRMSAQRMGARRVHTIVFFVNRMSARTPHTPHTRAAIQAAARMDATYERALIRLNRYLAANMALPCPREQPRI